MKKSVNDLLLEEPKFHPTYVESCFKTGTKILLGRPAANVTRKFLRSRFARKKVQYCTLSELTDLTLIRVGVVIAEAKTPADFFGRLDRLLQSVESTQAKR